MYRSDGALFVPISFPDTCTYNLSDICAEPSSLGKQVCRANGDIPIEIEIEWEIAWFRYISDEYGMFWTISLDCGSMYVCTSTCTPVRSPRSPHHPRPRRGRGAEYTNYPTKSTNCQKQQHLYCETATQHRNATFREDDAPTTAKDHHFHPLQSISYDIQLVMYSRSRYCEAPKHDQLAKKKKVPTPLFHCRKKAPTLNCGKMAEIVKSIS